MNTEQDLSGEDTEEILHPNENYDSGTERCEPTSAAGEVSISVTDAGVCFPFRAAGAA